MTAPKLEMTPDSEEPVVVASLPVEMKTIKSSATVEDIKEITDEFVESCNAATANEPAFMEPVSLDRALGCENPGSSQEDLANLNLLKDEFDNPPVFDSPEQNADEELSDQDFMARLVQEGIGKKAENVSTTIFEEEENVDDESLEIETDEFEFSKTSPDLKEATSTPEGTLIDLEQQLPVNSEKEKSDEKVESITNLLAKCFSTVEFQEDEIKEENQVPNWDFSGKEMEQRRQRGSLLLTSAGK